MKAIASKEAMQIAYFHLLFNCTTALITTPLIDYLEKIAKFVVKDEQKEDEVIEGLINDVKNIDINPRETINNEKDEKKNKENQKYEPPININNEEEKRDNKNDIVENKQEGNENIVIKIGKKKKIMKKKKKMKKMKKKKIKIIMKRKKKKKIRMI